MRAVIILSYLFGVALCVPVPVAYKEQKPALALPSPIQAEAADQVELARKRRTLFGIDVDVYNNNGFGYFDNGYGGGFGGYPGYGYGGFGGYPGYGGGFGGYPGYGYGGFGGYPGYGYGGFGGYPGYGGFF